MKEDLLKVLEDTIYKLYLPSHITNERSASKVDLIHYAIHRHLTLKLDNKKFKIWSKIIDKKEYLIKGAFLDKKVDIAIINIELNKVVANIEFKLLLSSIQKNFTNSFMNMIGETTNIQNTGIKSFWLFCLREISPVFNDKKVMTSFFCFKEKDLLKFKNAYNNLKDGETYLPKGLSINIYNDNLELESFKEKRDIGIALDRMQKDRDLELKFVDKFNYVQSKLFINEYEKFIEYVCEEVQGNE